MLDYSKGKIYTIRYRGDDSLTYVGSTINDLAKRWFQHKQSYSNEKRKDHKMKLYEIMRKTNDFDNWYIELWEEYPCQSKNELNKREGEIIRHIRTLNKKISGRTNAEYYQDNVEKYKQYCVDNKNKIQMNKKEYYTENKGEILEKQKLYAKQNQDKLSQRGKKYREDNQEKLSKFFCTSVSCDCGSTYTNRNKARHFKSQKHQAFQKGIPFM